MADIQVVTIGVQGPAGVSGSSVPATTTTLGGVIVGNNLTVLANGLLSANFVATTNLPWANITGKPTFANIATSGLYTDLTGTPNLSLYLTTANASTTYSVIGHTHAIANITGLQTALDGKQASGSYVLTSDSRLTDARTPLAHNQAWSTITSTPTTLGGYGITDGLTAATAASTYALQSTAITAGTGLTGGGTLAAGRTISLANTAVTAGVYGSSTLVPVVTVDAQGRITSVTTAAVSGGGGGSVTSVTGGAGITVTSCATTPVVAIDSTVATLTGTQTLTNKTLASPTITTELFCNSVPIRQAGVQRYSATASLTAYEQLTGSVLDINSATDVTLTLNSGTALPSQWNLTVVQTGAGKVTIAGAGSYTVVGRNGLRTAGQYAVVGIFQTTTTNVFVVTGDTIV